jgi:hypothetical protein
MRNILIASLLACAAALAASGASELCLLDRETESGMNKICFYSCASGDAAITIKSTQLCPLSIKR